MAKKNTPEFEALSVEAKVVCGAFWGIMLTTELGFERPWIIHERTRKGLDELVAAGYLTVEKFNQYSDKLIWKTTDKLRAELPRVSMKFMKENSFPVTTE